VPSTAAIKLQPRGFADSRPPRPGSLAERRRRTHKIDGRKVSVKKPPFSPDLEAAEDLCGDPAFQLLLRTQLDRETDLLGQRTAWVIASQAFLFSAYAGAVNVHIDSKVPMGGTGTLLLVHILPWISLLSLALLTLTIVAGVVTLVRFRAFFLATADARVRGLDAGPWVRAAGLIAPLCVPLIFVLAWIVIMAYR
jgi:hypothetical protein